MDKQIFIYKVGTDPRQATDYGGISYSETVVLADNSLSQDDLRYLLNKYLEVPFYKKFQAMYEDCSDYYNNIKITKIQTNDKSAIKEIISNLKEGRIIFLKCPDDYMKVFPDGFTFENLTVEEAKTILEKEITDREQEDLEMAFRQAIKKLDKNKILEILLELKEK